MLFEQLNPHACKTYLIAPEDDRRVILVDPVIDHFNDYLSLLDTRGYTLTHVIDTHTHADHISAGSALKDATGCAYIMHEKAPAQCVTDRVRDGDRLSLNGLDVDIIHTPGHTKDSISLIVGGRLLTGDFLFLDDGGGGRDDLPGGSPAEHWESLSKVYDLPDDLIVCPAHDYRNREPSAFGRQKGINPHYRKRTKEEFVNYIDDLKLGPADWMADVLKANYTCAHDPKAAWIPMDAAACEVKGTLEPGVNDIKVDYISASDLRQKLSSGTATVLLDVREPSELVSPLGAIDGVINVPIGSLAKRMSELDSVRDRDLVVVCRSGARATTAAQILMKSGFSNVSVLEGGMLAWNRAV
jgi:glyoxylase-like metal-dependent hydrolase (beta-lactamase superfamily II)